MFCYICIRADYYLGGPVPNHIIIVCLVLGPTGYTAYYFSINHCI